jgi:hypothetical protein
VSLRAATFLRILQLSSAVTVHDSGVPVSAPAFVAAALMKQDTEARALVLAQIDLSGRLISTAAMTVSGNDAGTCTTADWVKQVLDPRTHGVIAATLEPLEGEAGPRLATELVGLLAAAGVDFVDYVALSPAVCGTSLRAAGGVR